MPDSASSVPARSARKGRARHAKRVAACTGAERTVSIEQPSIERREESLVRATHHGLDGTDRALRPQFLDDYIGQENLRAQLRVYLQAARERGEALDHVLLNGPPGLGKTSLAHVIANELGVKLRITAGPVLERPGDLASILAQLEPNEVLFIDEIHRLPAQVEEILYPALEDYRLDITVGEADQARAVSVPLAPFTLVGATTRAGDLSAPLRDRFGIAGKLEYYRDDELGRIVARSAQLLGMTMELDAAEAIAKRSRGTPRIANRILRRVRDFAQVNVGLDKLITTEAVVQAFSLLGVGECGFDGTDMRYLTVLHEQFSGGPVGIDTLSVALSEARATLEDAVEPFLIQQGFIQRSVRGRLLTDHGRAWLEAHKTSDSSLEPELVAG